MYICIYYKKHYTYYMHFFMPLKILTTKFFIAA